MFFALNSQWLVSTALATLLILLISGVASIE
jgi:hypothetical protein